MQVLDIARTFEKIGLTQEEAYGIAEAVNGRNCGHSS